MPQTTKKHAKKPVKKQVKKPSERSAKNKAVKQILEELQSDGVSPLLLETPKPKDFGKRAILARELNISSQTLYNREDDFAAVLPQYFAGLSFLPRKGEGRKERPDLTEYQQFCQRQLEKLRQLLGAKNCQPNKTLIETNTTLFTVDFSDRQKQLEAEVISSESIETQTQERE